MHLNVFVSPKCFLYCNGCYSTSREEKKCTFLPTDKIIDFLKYTYKKGVHKVTICGGDPLTRSDILGLLEKIKSIGFFISLDTVGTTIIKSVKQEGTIKQIDIKKLVSLVDIIGIPIDGSTNNIIKTFRQTKSDIFNEQISICNKLNEYNANICINTVAHKGNLKDAINLANVINKLEYIKKWQIFQFIPMGKMGKMNRKNFEITDQEFIVFKKEISNFYNDADKLEFKSTLSRERAYMLIDNSGNAWISSINNQELVGNILNFDDWDKICLYLI